MATLEQLTLRQMRNCHPFFGEFSMYLRGEMPPDGEYAHDLGLHLTICQACQDFLDACGYNQQKQALLDLTD